MFYWPWIGVSKAQARGYARRISSAGALEKTTGRKIRGSDE